MEGAEPLPRRSVTVLPKLTTALPLITKRAQHPKNTQKKKAAFPEECRFLVTFECPDQLNAEGSNSLPIIWSQKVFAFWVSASLTFLAPKRPFGTAMPQVPATLTPFCLKMPVSSPASVEPSFERMTSATLWARAVERSWQNLTSFWSILP